VVGKPGGKGANRKTDYPKHFKKRFGKGGLRKNYGQIRTWCREEHTREKCKGGEWGPCKVTLIYTKRTIRSERKDKKDIGVLRITLGKIFPKENTIYKNPAF